MSLIATADIGGTNCRFGLFELEEGRLALRKSVWIATNTLADTPGFMAACARELELELRMAKILVAAIAGPVENLERGALSNGSLRLDFGPAKCARPLPSIFIINDFMAQAYAMLTRCGEEAILVAGPEKGPENATRAIIGAGTGLGQAMLINTAAYAPSCGWLALPSENGHAAFPFVGDAENDFHKFIREYLGIPYATGDDVLTGRGLRALHLFLTGKEMEPALVGKTALGADTETLAWYSRFYGRACRNWMLATMCFGGLWIAGGIAAQNVSCVQSPYFNNELYNHPKWREMLETIPARLMVDKDSGLWGAARAGMLLAGQQPKGTCV